MIRPLEWDTAFFGIKIGEWDADTEDASGAEDFDLIYHKSDFGDKPSLKGFSPVFSETKVVFAKRLSDSHEADANIITATESDNLQELYELAYESGRYSRFRLDERFGIENFKKLYRAWIDNSLSRQFADDILVYKLGSDLAGLVTYKVAEKYATIGLIAVSPLHQGRGMGRRLLHYVENELLRKDIAELRIPTQLENEAACAFYTKMGYHITERKNITHYRKNDTI